MHLETTGPKLANEDAQPANDFGNIRGEARYRIALMLITLKEGQSISREGNIQFTQKTKIQVKQTTVHRYCSVLRQLKTKLNSTITFQADTRLLLQASNQTASIKGYCEELCLNKYFLSFFLNSRYSIIFILIWILLLGTFCRMTFFSSMLYLQITTLPIYEIRVSYCRQSLLIRKKNCC